MIHREPSLNDRIQSLASLEEVEGYLLGIAMSEREVFPREVTLLERRIDSLNASRSAGEASGSAQRPSLGGDALKAKLRALAGRNRRAAE